MANISLHELAPALVVALLPINQLQKRTHPSLCAGRRPPFSQCCPIALPGAVLWATGKYRTPAVSGSRLRRPRRPIRIHPLTTAAAENGRPRMGTPGCPASALGSLPGTPLSRVDMRITPSEAPRRPPQDLLETPRMLPSRCFGSAEFQSGPISENFISSGRGGGGG